MGPAFFAVMVAPLRGASELNVGPATVAWPAVSRARLAPRRVWARRPGEVTRSGWVERYGDVTILSVGGAAGRERRSARA